MCDAHAYIMKNNQEELILENVDQMEIEGDEIRMINIFGEEKIVKARIKSYQNRENKFLLESI
ncbi:MAG: CooT family nickel-binding protein [bacterium]